MDNISNSEDIFDPSAKLFRLEAIKYILCTLFDKIPDSLKFVHVAGTNGKGSVSTMISSILMHSGYKTGLFTSPSVKSFMERIKINNIPMDFEEYKKIHCKILNESPEILKNKFDKSQNLSEFAITVIAAFNYFIKNHCDIAVLEAGIGGFKDATNIIDSPLISLITSVSFDHIQTLGNTLEEIAFQKSGIIKKNRPVIVAAHQKGSVYEVIRKTADYNSSKLIIPDPSNIEIISSDIENGTRFRFKGLNLKMNLLGKHQIENALTALTAIDIIKREINISDDAIKTGMETAFISARLEILSKNPLIILDGAHNEAGIRSLTEFIKEYLNSKNLIGIIGMCRDKNSTNEFSKILPLFNEIIPVEIPRFPRTMPLEQLSSITKKYNENIHPVDDPEQAIKYAIDKSGGNSAIVIFGSLYLARRILRNPNIIDMLNHDHA